MPQHQDKWKELFADLGRPTLRGIRKCPKCGTVNGTRGNSCKNKSCDVVFRDNGARKKASTEACRISFNVPECQVYSVRLRDRGPDYRNFVQLPITNTLQTELTKADSVLSIGSLPKCYVEPCNRNRQYPCAHIQAAQRCFSESQPLSIKHSVLHNLSIPSECQQVLSIFVNEIPDLLVQRVSKTSFVVKCNSSVKHPLGYLHIMFFKPNKDEGNSDKKFLCTCRPFKMHGRDLDLLSPGSNPVYDTPNKLCMHYYACICAFASNDTLASEFEYFLAQATQEYTPTLLSQLHLVTLPQSGNGRDVESMDPNQISVEIMRENISLLESIAAADDSSLPNVQGLEGVLSDQIIVTNVDDTLSFGDPSGLDGLDETDQQVSSHLTHLSESVVCQIFANAQNTIQLSNAFSSSENTGADSPPPTKKKKDIASDTSEQCSTSSGTSQFDKPLLPKRNSPVRTGGFKSTTITYTTTGQYNIPDKRPVVAGFELWLAGINERINHTMNYQFDGKPKPLIYYVPPDVFECLKERITSGFKKKRLPNQSVIIHRSDCPPVGTFTKHVWKITNIIHILQIFSCTIVPLKIHQYFIQTANGAYEEWNPPKDDDDPKNQPIVPVLHSTFIKVGKNDVNAKEFVPFIIEWIPEMFPVSKMGELSLSFQFGHTGAIQAEEDRRVNFRLQKTNSSSNNVADDSYIYLSNRVVLAGDHK